MQKQSEQEQQSAGLNSQQGTPQHHQLASNQHHKGGQTNHHQIAQHHQNSQNVQGQHHLHQVLQYQSNDNLGNQVTGLSQQNQTNQQRKEVKNQEPDSLRNQFEQDVIGQLSQSRKVQQDQNNLQKQEGDAVTSDNGLAALLLGKTAQQQDSRPQSKTDLMSQQGIKEVLKLQSDSNQNQKDQLKNTIGGASTTPKIQLKSDQNYQLKQDQQFQLSVNKDLFPQIKSEQQIQTKDNFMNLNKQDPNSGQIQIVRTDVNNLQNDQNQQLNYLQQEQQNLQIYQQFYKNEQYDGQYQQFMQNYNQGMGYQQNNGKQLPYAEYLSLLSFDNIEEVNPTTSSDNSKSSITFFFLLISMFLVYALFGYIIILIMLIISAFHELKHKFSMIWIFLWTIVSCVATLYTEYIQFFYYDGTSNIKYLFMDINSFQISTLLVISYIRACYVEAIEGTDMFKSILNFDTFRGLIFLNSAEKDQEASLFDIPFSEPLQMQKIQQRFSLFTIQPIPSQLNYSSQNRIIEFQKYIQPNFVQYSILLLTIAAKLTFGFYYVYRVHDQLTRRHIIDLVITIFVYLYTSFILNRVLGNYDLRRKADSMAQLNKRINFSNLKHESYKEKLDFTCPISLETWDNTRQYICSIDLPYLGDLEYAYFGLFFYYIFISIIIVTAYGEFYWIISKESVLIEPYMVILNTFNFIFLNFLIFFRLWEGQNFNDTFENQVQSIEYLIDIIEDISIMFEAYFEPYRFVHEQIVVYPKHYEQNKNEIENQKRQKREKFVNNYLTELQKSKDEQVVTYNDIVVDKNSLQGLLISRIKLTSNYYIDEKVQYLGKVYQKQDKALLRKEILKNTFSSLNKVKHSIINDAELYQYKFLNVVPISFSNTVTTVLIALFTLLPQVIPKFISYYTDNKS